MTGEKRPTPEDENEDRTVVEFTVDLSGIPQEQLGGVTVTDEGMFFTKNPGVPGSEGSDE